MKASMSGQKIALVDRIFSAWTIFRAHSKGDFSNAGEVIAFHKQLLDVFQACVEVELAQAKILDLGCGQTVEQVALFKADGADVIGVDMEVATHKMNIATFIKAARINGAERALKSLLRHIFFDKKFYGQLSEQYGKPLPLEQLELYLMDATRLSFPDNSFDFVYSAWTFEHIANVPAAIKEINRVLKPSGAAWIGVHLFPSLSGGHHLDWIYPEKSQSDKVPPWDHLLDNTHPVNTYLNRYRADQYREIFNEHIKTFKEDVTCEGEGLLSTELLDKLRQKGYSKEDLLTRTIIFLCRKNS